MSALPTSVLYHPDGRTVEVDANTGAADLAALKAAGFVKEAPAAPAPAKPSRK
jgi:hypothetical protein